MSEVILRPQTLTVYMDLIQFSDKHVFPGFHLQHCTTRQRPIDCIFQILKSIRQCVAAPGVTPGVGQGAPLTPTTGAPSTYISSAGSWIPPTAVVEATHQREKIVCRVMVAGEHLP